MKNKKKVLLIGGISLAVVVAIILCITLIPKNTQSAEKETESQKETTSDVSVDKPNEKETSSEVSIVTDKMIDDDTGLKATVEETTVSSKSKTTGTKTSGTATPITQNTTGENEGTTGGVTIGGDGAEAYNCGCTNHHCDGPETHAYIQNLEIEGCPYCGSHSCASFYATDEWGHTCYTPSKCPKYDIKKDPCYYCQSCGKKCGDGKGGTCVQFVNACECPNCGKHVDSWTCHTCK